VVIECDLKANLFPASPGRRALLVACHGVNATVSVVLRNRDTVESVVQGNALYTPNPGAVIDLLRDQLVRKVLINALRVVGLPGNYKITALLFLELDIDLFHDLNLL
jgi:hypothetical protein